MMIVHFFHDENNHEFAINLPEEMKEDFIEAPDSYIVKTQGYEYELITIREVLANGLNIFNLDVAIPGSTTEFHVNVLVRDFNLTVSLLTYVVDPNVHDNISYSGSSVELFLSSGEKNETVFELNSAMYDPKYKYVGEANFTLPEGLRNETVKIKIHLRGQYYSYGHGAATIPRTIEHEVVLK